MRSGNSLFIIGVAIIGVLGCAPSQEPQLSAETALDELWDVLNNIEAPEERVPMIEDFIIEYPDTSESVNALKDVVYYRTEKMGDLTGAISSARNTLGQTNDPELRFEIGLLLHDLTYQAGEASDLAAVASELAGHRTLGFVEHLDVVEAAEKTAGWEVMFDHASAMEAFANEEAFRAAYPDDDFTDEQVTFSANRRRSWVLAYKGGALTHLGRMDEADEVFRQVEAIPANTDFLGIPETPLDIYRGQAAQLLNRPEEAAAFFVHDALMGRDPRALEGMEEAYVALNGGPEGFGDYLLAMREEIARELPDVQLADYSGVRQELASTLGKVVVISFWNPG